MIEKCIFYFECEALTVLFVLERLSVVCCVQVGLCSLETAALVYEPEHEGGREGEDVRAVNSLPRMPFCLTCHQARLTDTPGG